MMGSTEHNMGRVAHNAFVFSWILEQIDMFYELANKSDLNGKNEWLKNWAKIEVEE